MRPNLFHSEKFHSSLNSFKNMVCVTQVADILGIIKSQSAHILCTNTQPNRSKEEPVRYEKSNNIDSDPVKVEN